MASLFSPGGAQQPKFDTTYGFGSAWQAMGSPKSRPQMGQAQPVPPAPQGTPYGQQPAQQPAAPRPQQGGGFQAWAPKPPQQAPSGPRADWISAGRPGFDANSPQFQVIGQSRDGTQFGTQAEARAYDQWRAGQLSVGAPVTRPQQPWTPSPRQPPFTQTLQTPWGQMEPSQFYRQRDAFIQTANNQAGQLMASAGTYTGEGAPPAAWGQAPQYNAGDMWSQAGRMVEDGWQNPFAMEALSRQSPAPLYRGNDMVFTGQAVQQQQQAQQRVGQPPPPAVPQQPAGEADSEYAAWASSPAARRPGSPTNAQFYGDSAQEQYQNYLTQRDSPPVTPGTAQPIPPQSQGTQYGQMNDQERANHDRVATLASQAGMNSAVYNMAAEQERRGREPFRPLTEGERQLSGNELRSIPFFSALRQGDRVTAFNSPNGLQYRVYDWQGKNVSQRRQDGSESMRAGGERTGAGMQASDADNPDAAAERLWRDSLAKTKADWMQKATAAAERRASQSAQPAETPDAYDWRNYRFSDSGREYDEETAKSRAAVAKAIDSPANQKWLKSLKPEDRRIYKLMQGMY